MLTGLLPAHRPCALPVHVRGCVLSLTDYTNKCGSLKRRLFSVIAALVPFGAQAPAPMFVVQLDPSTFTYDADRQVNVMADGRLWAEEPVAASSTATNNDTSPGNPPDEQADPYSFPEIDPEQVPCRHQLAVAGAVA
ncbi:putative ATP-grasp-modified RiPP [Streptomyces sioyaensis]|uniref:putative ATP-grasp-modified RiPP n=1 Tax=Streptomyces sioyaensis TaxID=67364 RepID=UPI0037B05C10